MNDALNQLRSLLERSSADGKLVEIFFRDDDVDEDEESLRQLLEIFTSRKIPLILGVLPAKLTASATALLLKTQRDFPGLIELTQHGWQHVNHEVSERKCEFGSSRNFAEQVTDIQRGQTRMNEAFGAQWFLAFIPPWNRCTAQTCQALNQLGFRVLSKLRGKAAPVTDFQGQEISVTLDIFTWKNGAMLKPAEEIFAELANQIKHGEPLGIMLHHKVMNDQSFAFLESLLIELSASSAIRFHTFQSLLKTK